MVDLGFLLITFFIFTTSLATPTAMKLTLPDDTPNKYPSLTSAGKTLTLILDSNNEVYYYQGFLQNHINKKSYNQEGIRVLLFKTAKDVKEKYGEKNELVVIIKPTINCSYKNLVDVIDEMLICNIKKYVVVEPSVNELSIINNN
jgi:biopolymer transport protein ExbD